MIKFIMKWIIASLIMPIITIMISLLKIDSSLDTFILMFWPSSIFLISLGGRENTTFDIVYVWSFAVSVNMILYSIIGLFVFFVLHQFKATKKYNK